MPKFELDKKYTGEQIVSFLEPCVYRKSKDKVNFISGLRIDKSRFALKNSNIITHGDLKVLEEKLNYYIVKYKWNDSKDKFFPEVDTEQVFSINYGSSIPFTVNPTGERHFCNGFLIPSSGYIASSFSVQDQYGNQIPMYQNDNSAHVYKDGYYLYYCDLIPGEKYAFFNNANLNNLTAYYVTMKGDEW